MKLQRLVFRNSAARDKTAFCAGRKRSWTFVVFNFEAGFDLVLRMMETFLNLAPPNILHHVRTMSMREARLASCRNDTNLEIRGSLCGAVTFQQFRNLHMSTARRPGKRRGPWGIVGK